VQRVQESQTTLERNQGQRNDSIVEFGKGDESEDGENECEKDSQQDFHSTR
jgi:hypothetical protein